MQQTAQMVPGHVRRRAALMLALVLAASLGPAGAQSPVVSSAMIPLNGTVDNIRLSGVAHVVTHVLLQEPTPFSTGFKTGVLTVNAYLTPSDVSAVDHQGKDYLAHGAGTATMVLSNTIIGPPIPVGMIPVGVLMPVGGAPINSAPTVFSLQLHLSFASTGELDAIHSTAHPLDGPTQ